VVEGRDATVAVRMRNTGSRAGREVVQLYASRPDSAVERPVRWLAGFGAVEAPAGGEAAVEVVLTWRALAHWDAGAGRLALEPGVFALAAGRSSRDLVASGEVRAARS
jgi:beta-glucosidase